ncbi:hypothetical protein AKJ62_00435 [candidate division MSBL1 archaeon SCGC-AAA259D14]|uniref:N-acetyltransferase domain-containing protein n=2 Tax=candidate division MSBL1 TaxID=215777 RepID=A0A133U8P3_9EURY|nr:hypothetical protein AKJ62_00435 [candidate division MSBL1 archaeon SCGC-AAA259D14]KXA93579.1 hypothetical protein AKJ66_01730 [candidate division MSBL1 archaeon SCGC-AAA259E22]
MVTQKIISVRDVEPEDLPIIHEIAEESFKDPYPLSLLKHIYETKPEGFMAAEIGGEIVGYLIGLVRWGDVGHILAIAVDELHREKGVGSALLINAIDRLKNNGANRIRLEVRVSNEIAQEFYGKIGFKPRKVVPAYYSDGEDAVSMEYKCK